MKLNHTHMHTKEKSVFTQRSPPKQSVNNTFFFIAFELPPLPLSIYSAARLSPAAVSPSSQSRGSTLSRVSTNSYWQILKWRFIIKTSSSSSSKFTSFKLTHSMLFVFTASLCACVCVRAGAERGECISGVTCITDLRWSFKFSHTAQCIYWAKI